MPGGEDERDAQYRVHIRRIVRRADFDGPVDARPVVDLMGAYPGAKLPTMRIANLRRPRRCRLCWRTRPKIDVSPHPIRLCLACAPRRA